jgi:hypothetical protein
MKPWILGLSGFVVVAGSAVLDFFLLDVPEIRNGYWTYLPIAIGVVMAVIGLIRERVKATWTFALLCAVGFLGYSVGRFLPAPPVPPAAAVGQKFPDFTLPDQDGKLVSLAELRRTGPVVVVFFRGGW